MAKLQALKQKKEAIERKLKELEQKLDEDESANDAAVDLFEDLANIKYQIGKLECDHVGIDGTLYF